MDALELLFTEEAFIENPIENKHRQKWGHPG